MITKNSITLLFITYTILVFSGNSYASCEDDIRDHCYETYKNDDNVLECLARKQLLLSKSCKEDMKSIQQAWGDVLIDCREDTKKYCDKSTSRDTPPFPDCLLEKKRWAYQACRNKIRDYEWAVSEVADLNVKRESEAKPEPEVKIKTPLNTKAGGDKYFSPVRTASALYGCWKRIIFSDAAMRQMNKTEPYPLKHQWYCFLDGGKYQELLSNRDDGKPIEQKIKFMNAFPGQDYSIAANGIVTINHPDRKRPAVWITSIVINNIKLWGIELKLGDMLMTIRDPVSNKDVYYRFMRKVRK